MDFLKAWWAKNRPTKEGALRVMQLLGERFAAMLSENWRISLATAVLLALMLLKDVLTLFV